MAADVGVRGPFVLITNADLSQDTGPKGSQLLLYLGWVA